MVLVWAPLSLEQGNIAAVVFVVHPSDKSLETLWARDAFVLCHYFVWEMPRDVVVMLWWFLLSLKPVKGKPILGLVC